MTTYIKAGSEVQILALGLDGGYICHDIRQDVEIIWRSAETEDSVLVQAQSSDTEQIWTILAHPDDLVDPDVWDGELDRGLVLLDILQEVNSIPAMAPRAAVKAALRSMVEQEWTPEAIMDAWRSSKTKRGGLPARCVRMAYAASQELGRAIHGPRPEWGDASREAAAWHAADEGDNIADRMKTLSGPKEKR